MSQPLRKVVGRGVALRLNAPDWFARPDFQAWLSGTRVFTWHNKTQAPGDYSDAIVLVDTNFEGSDQGALPDDIWDVICRTVYDSVGETFDEVVTVRMTNLPE